MLHVGVPMQYNMWVCLSNTTCGCAYAIQHVGVPRVYDMCFNLSDTNKYSGCCGSLNIQLK